MPSAHQDRVQSEEKALEAYRQERYQGSARVRLDCLTFDRGFGHLIDDGRNAMRLEQILEIQGCLRINRDYHVPVLVPAADWGSHIRLLPCETEPFPELTVPLHTSLRALDHENLIAAARKKLYGENRWWVVDVYVEDDGDGQPHRQSLQSHFVRSLREHFPNQRRPPDGLIYERIRFYQGKLGHPPDATAEAAWWAMLRHDPKSKKHVYLRAFLQHRSFPAAFDALLPIPGLWAKMQLGVLHTMIALRCDEPILAYLDTIRHIWVDRILGGCNTLAVHANAETVLALESRVPKRSEEDAESLRPLIEDDRTLFPSLRDAQEQKELWERLKQIDVPIPTLGTFFQDLRFLGVARKVLKTLLLPSGERGSKARKATIDGELSERHRIDASTSLQEERRHLRQGLLELWRFSFQYGLEMTGVARRQPRKNAKHSSFDPLQNGSPGVDRTALWRHLLWLADQHGFQIVAPAGLAPMRMSLPISHVPDDPERAEDEPVSRRCGIPFTDTVDADRCALEGDRLWHPAETRRITAGFIRQTQFRTFFRYLWDGDIKNQSGPATDGAAATPAAATVDQEMWDRGSDRRTRSPSFSQWLQISSPASWSMAFWECGLGPLDTPASHLAVTVTLPHREPRRMSLPNDEPLINHFFDGLKLRRFSLYDSCNHSMSRVPNFYLWHQECPWETVHAKLTEGDVQDYTASDENRQKRRRKGLAEAIDEIAAWVDEQAHRLSTPYTGDVSEEEY